MLLPCWLHGSAGDWDISAGHEGVSAGDGFPPGIARVVRAQLANIAEKVSQAQLVHWVLAHGRRPAMAIVVVVRGPYWSTRSHVCQASRAIPEVADRLRRGPRLRSGECVGKFAGLVHRLRERILFVANPGGTTPLVV